MVGSGKSGVELEWCAISLSGGRCGSLVPALLSREDREGVHCLPASSHLPLQLQHACMVPLPIHGLGIRRFRQPASSPEKRHGDIETGEN